MQIAHSTAEIPAATKEEICNEFIDLSERHLEVGEIGETVQQKEHGGHIFTQPHLALGKTPSVWSSLRLLQAVVNLSLSPIYPLLRPTH